MLRRIGDEAVLVPIAGEAAARGRLFVVNDVGRVIWDQLTQAADLAAVVEAVVARFDVDAERATEDVLRFVGELVAAGCATEVDR